MARLRCAIYTRKSTEDGLDQAFNSLDAQREACDAFITSQRHEGWRALPDQFDDGGFSGGTMERPGLTQLLGAVRRNQVDVIVVYKVDRLTRSLADFAKIVALLDAHEVSFVSVTQQFNTTSSMGRLTLNVLLSFAQFEREVTAERIRDKIAASKKKGLWTGGPVPIGYDVKEKALVPNPAEAETVRHLFQLYLTHGSVRELETIAAAEGIVTKRRKGVGARAGGNPLSRGALYKLLSNPTYVGRIAYRGDVYDGRHPPIIDLDLWDAVQAKLKAGAPERTSSTNAASPSFFAGILFDETGDRLTPSHANKAGKRYRYYVSSRLHLGKDQTGWRLPAPMLEALVFEILDRRLADPLALLGAGVVSPDAKMLLQLENVASDFRRRLAGADAQERATAVRALVRRIDLSPKEMRIALSPDVVAGNDFDPIVIAEPVQLRRRGVESRLMSGALNHGQTNPDPKLLTLVSRAHRWRDLLVEGRYRSVIELAAGEGVNRWDVSKQLPFAYLAPDIVTAILDGKQPIGLTASRLRRAAPLPFDWNAQRRVLGFDQ